MSALSLRGVILDAMRDYENNKPRSKQFGLGPSELGGCREYIRNVMVGTLRQDNREWPTAAVVGTLVGEYVEMVCRDHLGAMTQVPVTTTLPNGLQVSGHGDVVLPVQNVVVDVKTKDRLDEVLKEGASLDNRIQVSVYALGLVQANILDEGASAHLLYIDRSGNQQFLHEIVLEWQEILDHVDLCVQRLEEVLEAQRHIDQGQVEYARDLRDKTPPFCYSERVMCPFREACWKGSEWNPHDTISDAETIDKVERYAANRDDVRATDTIRRTLREELRGVTGVTPSGWSVTWQAEMLFVTRVKRADSVGATPPRGSPPSGTSVTATGTTKDQPAT